MAVFEIHQIDDNEKGNLYKIRAIGLKAPIQVSATGDVTGSQTTDLSSDVEIPMTIPAGTITEEKIDSDLSQDLVRQQELQDEASTREDADAEIITSLEDETEARRLNDELLSQQIEEVAVQTDWNEDNTQSLAYLKNHPTAISDLEIEALFV